MNSLTTGAGNDLERSTEMARKMVCEWGMSDAMGPLTFGKKEEQIFLGREIAQHQDYSEDTALKIDQEVKRFVTTNYERVQLLTEHKDVLLKMADALLAREVLDAEQVRRLCARARHRRAEVCCARGGRVRGGASARQGTRADRPLAQQADHSVSSAG
ncbi:MAG: hypothetical protein U0Q55_23535 [Vicinamibacterales bacterium]